MDRCFGSELSPSYFYHGSGANNRRRHYRVSRNYNENHDLDDYYY